MASTADRRKTLAALAAERDRRTWRAVFGRRGAAVLLLLALLGLAGCWLLGFFSGPKEVAALRRIVDAQVVQMEAAARTGTPPDQVASVGTVMEQMRAVPRAYREQAAREAGRYFEARDRAEMDSYFALPADRRQAELDRRIRADEERRKTWQAERERREQQRAAAGGTDAANGPRGQGDAPRPAAQAGGPPGPGGGRRGGTEDSRNERSKRQIDRSTPEERARRAEYRRAVEERRTQLGLGSRRPG